MARTTRGDLPFGVVVVALGFMLNAVLYALALGGFREGTALAQRILGDTGMGSWLYGSLIVLCVATALLLLRSRPAGWVLAMLLACVALAFYLAGWWLGTPEYLRMAIFAFIALYMNQREVRAAFAGAGAAGAHGAAAVAPGSADDA